MCVRACARARVCVCVRVRVCAYVCVCAYVHMCLRVCDHMRVTECVCAFVIHTGDLPYSELGNTVILSRVMAGYKLDCPQGCPHHMYAHKLMVGNSTCITLNRCM